MPYSNPVIRGFHPDPSICRVGTDYYLVTSSFEYFPGLPIFHSTDLVNWDQIGHCLTRRDQVDLTGVESSAGIWAPTLRYRAGVFYVISTVMRQGNFTNALTSQSNYAERPPLGRHFIVSATSPAGPWSDPLWIDGGGLDPSLLFDDDGRVFVTHAENGLVVQSTIDPASFRRESEPRAIWGGTFEKTTEGPHLYHIGAFYYLLVAEGGTSYGHSISLARSREPWGPWEDCPTNPILTHRARDGHPIQATGHGDLFDDARGNWWIVFLGVRSRGYPSFHHLGRETFLAPVEWVDGWPVIAESVELRMAASPPGGQREQTPRWHDDFSQLELRTEWNSLRGPSHAVRLHDGQLVLSASSVSLDTVGTPAFIGVRQIEPTCRAEAELTFLPEVDGDEAGLTVFMNERHRYDVALVQETGTVVARLRRRIGSLVVSERRVAAPQGPVRLRVDATPFMYYFSLVFGDDRPATLLGAGEAFYLSSEVAGGFTGVYLGLYNTGAGSVAVHWFELES